MPQQDPEARRAYMRAYYLANREKLIEKAKEWNAAHPSERRAGQRKWYEAHGREYRRTNPDKIAAAQARYYASHTDAKAIDNRKQRLRRNFGLTIAEYESLLAGQDGLCAICRKTETHRNRHGEITRLAIDHDHVTGSIRALLCHACNTGIGSFYDDPQLLMAAANYIKDSMGSSQ